MTVHDTATPAVVRVTVPTQAGPVDAPPPAAAPVPAAPCSGATGR